MSNSAAVTVTTEPTLLYAANGPDKETVTIDTVSGSTVTVGGPDVVAGQGPQLAVASNPLPLMLYEDSVYGVVASGTAEVAVFSVLSGSGE